LKLANFSPDKELRLFLYFVLNVVKLLPPLQIALQFGLYLLKFVKLKQIKSDVIVSEGSTDGKVLYSSLLIFSNEQIVTVQKTI